ncbi:MULTISPECIES: aggregation-promoting factor C-terminal-like domain-containing protein [Arthrobacter]|uniref:aggregation-promoting factor C-terminal-like domain-containing protein n=1 Tax=unclassified Arthrobacter TaxID=235627 RepID=UPI0024B8FE41|nr:transglycosylase [Arthrobacter sp. H35-MC1]MDJ0317977.1 transglycosylase [Arthrobacter sp. H35-MC1]
MSAAPQRGRRRAESKRPVSAVSAVSATAKYMAAVAVLGAVLAGGAVAQQVGAATPGGQNLAGVVSSASNSTPAPSVSAPLDAAISFSDLNISSSTSATPSGAALKAQANDVKTEATGKAEKEPAASPTAAPAPVDDPAAAQSYASGQLGSFGWGADQMSCLTQLWERESSWLTSAENASSGAYGIAQSLPANKMDSTGSDWASNYQTQIRWGLGYIQARYGSPCAAWGHSNAVGWY